MDGDIISVSEAIDRLLKGVEPLPAEEVHLSEAQGRVLAQTIKAGMDLPPFSNSSMDGFAVRAEDVIGASEQGPVNLEVVGDISAGEGEVPQLERGQAVRIMTGGVLPKRANSVVPVEFTSEPGALVGKKLNPQVEIHREVSEGDYIRLSGQDVRKGTQVLSKGHRLRPQDIGIVAALGISSLMVHRQPRVAVISTGDELVEIGEKLQPGSIYNSNGYALAAAVESSGAIPLQMGIVPDNAKKLSVAFNKSVRSGVDLIISSAGVSMGAYDFVRTVVEKHGHLEFWRVNIRPGKPILSGSYQGTPLMGLPGNPVSALITFEIFVKPYIYRLSGAGSVSRFKLSAKLLHPISSDGRESYLRACVSQDERGFMVRLVGSQDSGVLSSLVEANALIRIPAGVKSLSDGKLVEVWVLRQDGIL